MGRGPAIGPDLTNIGRQATVAELERKLKNPSAQISDSYITVTARLRDGRSIKGFARKETLHGLQLQSLDGKLMLLGADEYQVVARDKVSNMPPLAASADEQRDLMAFLSRLGGTASGPLPGPGDAVDAASID